MPDSFRAMFSEVSLNPYVIFTGGRGTANQQPHGRCGIKKGTMSNKLDLIRKTKRVSVGTGMANLGGIGNTNSK